MRFVPRLALSRVALVAALSASSLALSTLAAPAGAQYVPRHDPWDRGQWGRGGAVWVEGVYPARTVPGGRVSLRGTGFTSSTQVFVDGHAVAVESVRPDEIVFLAPHHEGPGQIVLRDPRVGDHAVGTIVIDVAPGHASPHPGYAPGYGQPGYGQPGYGQPGYGQPGYRQPGYGPPGYRQPGYGPPGHRPPSYDPGRRGYGPPSIARVEVDPRPRGVRIVVEGRGFTPGDSVAVGGVRAEVRQVNGDRLVAWAPPGAAGPVTWVSARDGRRYDTGAYVTPSGYARSPRRDRSGYAPYPYDGRVPYDRYARDGYGHPAQIGPIHVQGRRGGEVLVVISGLGFGPDAQVWLGRAPVPVVSRSDDELIVAVPRGLSGTLPVTIETRGTRVTSSTSVVLPR